MSELMIGRLLALFLVIFLLSGIATFICSALGAREDYILRRWRDMTCSINIFSVVVLAVLIFSLPPSH